MKISVLTYHSANILGNEYHNNDHVAFESDLKLIHELDLTILSAHDLILWLNNDIKINESKDYVVITFDDGLDLDYINWDHPSHGFQKSFYNLMLDFKNSYNKPIHATSFVIASPSARYTLAEVSLGGHEIWNDDWWQEVENSTLISIENHSWDHLHPSLDQVQQQNNIKGDFSKIETYHDANKQIKNASTYINLTLKDKTTRLFAYPNGDYNSYLINNYFPNLQNEIKGAFTCGANYVEKDTNIWSIPRFVCGDHWKSPSQLKSILT